MYKTAKEEVYANIALNRAAEILKLERDLRKLEDKLTFYKALTEQQSEDRVKQYELIMSLIDTAFTKGMLAQENEYLKSQIYNKLREYVSKKIWEVGITSW